MQIKYFYLSLPKLIFISLLISHTILFSLNVEASEKVVACEPPVESYDLAFLADIKFHGDSSIPEFWTTLRGFNVKCQSGSSPVLEGESVTFQEDGSLSSITVGSNLLLSQNLTSIKLSRLSKLRFNENRLASKSTRYFRSVHAD